MKNYKGYITYESGWQKCTVPIRDGFVVTFGNDIYTAMEKMCKIAYRGLGGNRGLVKLTLVMGDIEYNYCVQPQGVTFDGLTHEQYGTGDVVLESKDI